jgi:hypothetical protein
VPKFEAVLDKQWAPQSGKQWESRWDQPLGTLLALQFARTLGTQWAPQSGTQWAPQSGTQWAPQSGKQWESRWG